MSLRFVHAADLHLDSPFLELASSPDAERVARTLRDATFAAYDAIIDLCIRERVDALLVAGDVYDGADSSFRAQLRFVAGLNRLHEAGIRSFVCHGNHDPLDGWEAGLDMPGSCHRFGPEVESVPFDPANPSRGTVYGMSYPRQSVKENVARRFRRDQQGGVAIGLLHCNVGSNTGHAPYAPCTLEDLVDTGMDYWALGHVHTAQVLRAQSPAVVYPGNPQGRHPNETGPRGACLVNIDDAGRVTIESRPMDVVRWSNLSVPIDGLGGLQELLDRIESDVGDALEAAEGRHLLYRLALTGQGELHHDLQRTGLLEEIRSDRNDAIGSPFAWCGRISDITRPAFDRQQALGAGDFLSEVLALVDGARGDPAAQNELAEGLDVFYANDRARKYLKDELPTGGEFERLLTEAETLIAEFLAGDLA
jgi:DNA repair exonuclease SbcCD nuclease subunit